MGDWSEGVGQTDFPHYYYYRVFVNQTIKGLQPWSPCLLPLEPLPPIALESLPPTALESLPPIALVPAFYCPSLVTL